MANKTELTLEEVIKVGFLYHIMHTEQHALSIAFEVNPGRISEACQVMEHAARNVHHIYDELKRVKDTP